MAEYSYIARNRKCNCIVGLCVDYGDKRTAAHVAEFVRDGCYIERVNWAAEKERLCGEPGFMNCQHEDAQLALDLDP